MHAALAICPARYVLNSGDCALSKMDPGTAIETVGNCRTLDGLTLSTLSLISVIFEVSILLFIVTSTFSASVISTCLFFFLVVFISFSVSKSSSISTAS